MRAILKKLGFLTIMIMILGTMAACGNEGTKEHIKTGEERALELQKEAKEAVDKVNDETAGLTEFEKKLDLE